MIQNSSSSFHNKANLILGYIIWWCKENMVSSRSIHTPCSRIQGDPVGWIQTSFLDVNRYSQLGTKGLLGDLVLNELNL